MVAVGSRVIVTVVFVVMDGQLPDAGTVYVTV